MEEYLQLQRANPFGVTDRAGRQFQDLLKGVPDVANGGYASSRTGTQPAAVQERLGRPTDEIHEVLHQGRLRIRHDAMGQAGAVGEHDARLEWDGPAGEGELALPGRHEFDRPVGKRRTIDAVIPRTHFPSRADHLQLSRAPRPKIKVKAFGLSDLLRKKFRGFAG